MSRVTEWSYYDNTDSSIFVGGTIHTILHARVLPGDQFYLLTTCPSSVHNSEYGNYVLRAKAK